MRVPLLLLVFLACLILPASLAAQQATSTASAPPTATDPQAVALVQRALIALTGGVPVTDVTLTGTARRIAGSDDETGTVTLRAASASEGRIDLALPSGSRSEVRGTTSSGMPGGNWSGPDGATHEIAFHNLLTDTVWFYPTFLIARASSSQNCVVSYIGHEIKNGAAVEHVSIWQQMQQGSQLPAALQQLGRTDLYLDSTSLLPIAEAFAAHPDNNAGLDIPVEIDFSSYQLVQGFRVPFHLQRFLNNGLILDLTVTEAQFNSGLSNSTFSVQ